MSNILTKNLFKSLTSILLLVTLFTASISFAQVDNAAGETGLLREQRAINKLGNRLAVVAAEHGKTPNQLRRMFLEDETLHIDKNGRLLYVEKAPDEAEVAAAQAVSAPQAAPYPYSETFALHSRPNSSRKIYLDFNGHTISSTNAWRAYLGGGVAAPYDLDGAPNSFSAAEQDVIQNIWQRMSEDYAPFDVDVTTEDPGETFYGSRAVMTPTNFMGAGVGGVAYVGAFIAGENYQPAWIFTGGFGSSDKGITEAASHEVGHTLGLHHDESSTQGYYSGHGVWAPIMGVGYNKSVTQWSKGEYPGANNNEDDLAIIQQYTPLINDDYGNTTATANVLSGTSINVSGLITTRTDADVFQFTTGSGNVSININPAPRGANLDIKAQILDSAGNVVATSDPSSFSLSGTFPAGMSAGFNQTLAAGTYYLRVDGVGSAGDDPSAGYSDYASIGQYNVTGTLASTGGASQPPVAVATVNGATSGTTPFAVNFSSAGSFDPDGSIVNYNWNFGDGTGSTAQNPSKVYNSAGTFTAVLTVTDNSGLNGTNSVVVAASNPVTPTPTPAASYSISGTVSYGTTPAGSPAKYVPGVTLTAAGTPLVTTGTDTNGSYSLNGLGAGQYTVTPSKATQTNKNGISLQDASEAARLVFNQGTANQRIAADATGNGSVSFQDASEIAKHFFNIAGTNIVEQWKFVSSPRPYPNVSSNLSGENYEAILVGDVTGNWTPPSADPAAGAVAQSKTKGKSEISKINGILSIISIVERQRQQSAADSLLFTLEPTDRSETNQRGGAEKRKAGAAQVSLPNAQDNGNTTVLIPVMVSDLTGLNMTSYDLTVTFDPNIMQPDSPAFETAGTLSAAAGGYSVFVDPNQPSGRVRIGAFGTTPLSGSGTLIFLRFTVPAGAAATSPLNFENFIFGEGSPPDVTTNGSFMRLGPTAAAATNTRRSLTSGRGIEHWNKHLLFNH